MATNYGVNATKRANSSIPSLENQGETNSPIKIAYDEFTLTAALAQNDTVRLMKLPPKARVINVHVYCDALDASGGTMDIGWEANGVDAADDDGFIANLAVTSAIAQDMAGDQGTRPGLFKQFGNAETQVTITADAVGGWDATTGSVKVAVYYTVS